MVNKSCPVSVVIPCYCASLTIERAVFSVLKQSLKPKEILIVDDCSIDSTFKKLLILKKKFPRLIRIFRLKINSGPGHARNLGWDMSTQPWIAFLDADDMWHEDKLKIQYNFVKNSNYHLCGHTSALYNIKEVFRKEIKVINLSFNQMLFSNIVPARSVMLRSDLPFRFLGKNLTEDYLLWLEIIGSGYKGCFMKYNLAFTFRSEFSTGGYSGNLLRHEIRELKAYYYLLKHEYIKIFTFFLVMVWSLLKFLRRICLNLFRF
jgi:glycosyltransferase involved in cell wall biosynthesis